MAKVQLTKELVKQLFDYKDGFLYWNKSPANTVKIGDKAGTVEKYKGGHRIRIKVIDKRHMASHLIFLWHHGWMPDYVDHIDRNTLNDKIENLRAATKAENNRNRTSLKNSTSKYLGVCLRGKSWRAGMSVSGKRINIGTFKSETDAALAYNRMAVRYHKEFANLNIIQP